MKNFLLSSMSLLLMTLGFVSCSVMSDNVTPQQAADLRQLEMEVAQSQATLADAKLSGDQNEIYEARQAVETAEANLNEFKDRVVRERTGSVIAWVSGLFGPIGAMATPVLTAMLLPLAGKRGRKHAGSALKNTFRLALASAFQDVWRMIGAAHTSGDTQMVSDGRAIAMPVKTIMDGEDTA